MPNHKIHLFERELDNIKKQAQKDIIEKIKEKYGKEYSLYNGNDFRDLNEELDKFKEAKE